MATDDERREVARRLRGLDIPVRVKKAEHPEKTAAWYELICSAVGGKKDPWFGVKALADRLADLIEPPTQCPYYHSGRHYCSAYDDVVDRDALLALADEMETADPEDLDVAIDYVTECASRIREALGWSHDERL